MALGQYRGNRILPEDAHGADANLVVSGRRA
jgi:hypothetical protein